MVGDGVDRRRWRMQGDGGRENNKQTRHRPKVPQYVPIVFQGDRHSDNKKALDEIQCE